MAVCAGQNLSFRLGIDHSVKVHSSKAPWAVFLIEAYVMIAMFAGDVEDLGDATTCLLVAVVLYLVHTINLIRLTETKRGCSKPR